MSSYAGTDNPQTATGVGGAQDFSQYAQYGLPQALPTDELPAGAYTDAQYLEDIAGLRGDIASQYADELGYLGYTDANGNYVPGSLLTEAQINEAQYEQARQQAIKQTTQTAQQQGTLFSGQRGVQQAEAEAPYLSSIAGIEQRLPVDMSSHFTKAAGLISDYENQQNALLSSAAARGAAAAAANPPATGDTTPPATGGTTPPPPGPEPGGGEPQPGTTYETLPYRSGTMPFQMFAGGGEADGPTPALIGEEGPEAVVPRTTLTPQENQQLTGLREAAQSRMMRRNDVPGIHWFGPGGSGIDYPTGQPPVAYPPRSHPLDPGPVFVPHPGVHPPIGQWIAHHPGAMRTGKFIPHWAELAIAARNRIHMPPGIGWRDQVLPGHIVPPPGITPAGGGFRY